MTKEDNIFNSKGYLKRRKKYEKIARKKEKKKALNEYIKDEIKAEKSRRLTDIEEKKEHSLQILEELYEKDPSQMEDPNMYIAIQQKKLKKLRKKEWKIIRKGLGCFTISKIIVEKIIKDKYKKRKNIEINNKDYEELLQLKESLQNIIDEQIEEKKAKTR